MKEHLKILSIVGLILVFYGVISSSTKNFSPYLLEIAGMIILGLYAWCEIKSRILILWITGFFSFSYLFLNYSLTDFLYWVLAFYFTYKDSISNS